MITIINSNDTIKTLGSGQYRAHRQAAFWIGDYPTHKDAVRALQIANSHAANTEQRGIYDGGVNATEEQHLEAVATVFGVENRVTMDDVSRTILVGEPMRLIGGLFPARV